MENVLQEYCEATRGEIEAGIVGEVYFHSYAFTLDEQLSVLSQELGLEKMPVLKSEEEKRSYLERLEDDYTLKVMAESAQRFLPRFLSE